MLKNSPLFKGQQGLTFAITAVLVLAIFTLSLLASRGTLQDADLHDIPGVDEQRIFVSRVIDGDTIELITGDRVRYIGIDTPEQDHDGNDHECFADEATERNRELVEGVWVRLERDISNRDTFGRLLRHVHVNDTFVNETLVREGYARAASFPPDTRHDSLFHEAEQEAREHNRGMWGSC